MTIIQVNSVQLCEFWNADNGVEMYAEFGIKKAVYCIHIW